MKEVITCLRRFAGSRAAGLGERFFLEGSMIEEASLSESREMAATSADTVC